MSKREEHQRLLKTIAALANEYFQTRDGCRVLVCAHSWFITDYCRRVAVQYLHHTGQADPETTVTAYNSAIMVKWAEMYQKGWVFDFISTDTTTEGYLDLGEQHAGYDRVFVII